MLANLPWNTAYSAGLGVQCDSMVKRPSLLVISAVDGTLTRRYHPILRFNELINRCVVGKQVEISFVPNRLVRRPYNDMALETVLVR